MAVSRAPHVVIIGGGFAGLNAARCLARLDVRVTVVDRRNHHLFQPLLYQVATAALSPADIAGPIRSTLSHARNVRVLLDNVTGVDTEAARVKLSSGTALDYDWLVLATGARHSYFGRDEWANNAPGLKSIEDATAIRRTILLALEKAESELDGERRQQLLTFVVIGAGPTGVEMAGAVAELARRAVSNDFRSITPHCSRVILVEAGDRVLPSFPASLSRSAEQSLRELGVEIRLGAPVRDVGSGYIQLGQELIFARTIIWAAGVQASPAAEWLDVEHDTNGRVFVQADLRAPSHDRIFVIGDTANAAGPSGTALPAVAPVAKQQGRYVADYIIGRRSRAFAYRDYGNLATIGRSKAVIDWGNLQLSGFAAWLIWSVAHIWFLVGFRSRIAVATSWLWSYATYQRSARLITGETADTPNRRRSPPAFERKCA